MFAGRIAVRHLLCLCVGVLLLQTLPAETSAGEQRADDPVRILKFEGTVLKSRVGNIKPGDDFHGRVVWSANLIDMDPREDVGLFMSLRAQRTSTAALLGGSNGSIGAPTRPQSDVHYTGSDTAPDTWVGPGDEPGDWIIITDESNSSDGTRRTMVFGGVSEALGLVLVRVLFTDPRGKTLVGGKLPKEIKRDMFKTATVELVNPSGEILVESEIKRVGRARSY